MSENNDLLAAKAAVKQHAARVRTRNTPQRQAVLEAVRAFESAHPSAAEVYARLRRVHPHLSLATVYRALHALVQQRALTEMRVENTARYDAGPRPHHHLVCRACGAIRDVDADSLPAALVRQLSERIEQVSDFALGGGSPIQFSGLCPACR